MQQSASEHGDACVNSVQDRGSIPLASILEKAYQARPDTLFSYPGCARVFRAGAARLHFIPAHAGISYTGLPVYFIERSDRFPLLMQRNFLSADVLEAPFIGI